VRSENNEISIAMWKSSKDKGKEKDKRRREENCQIDSRQERRLEKKGGNGT